MEKVTRKRLLAITGLSAGLLAVVFLVALYRTYLPGALPTLIQPNPMPAPIGLAAVAFVLTGENFPTAGAYEVTVSPRLKGGRFSPVYVKTVTVTDPAGTPTPPPPPPSPPPTDTPEPSEPPCPFCDDTIIEEYVELDAEVSSDQPTEICPCSEFSMVKVEGSKVCWGRTVGGQSCSEYIQELNNDKRYEDFIFEYHMDTRDWAGSGPNPEPCHFDVPGGCNETPAANTENCKKILGQYGWGAGEGYFLSYCVSDGMDSLGCYFDSGGQGRLNDCKETSPDHGGQSVSRMCGVSIQRKEK